MSKRSTLRFVPAVAIIAFAMAMMTSASSTAQIRGEPPHGRTQGQQTPTPAPEGAASTQQSGEAQPSAADDVTATVTSAMVKLSGWRYRAAREQLEAVKEKASGDAGYRVAMALVRAEEGQLAEAITELQAAASATPKDPAPKLYLGEVAFWKRDYDLAQAGWKAALERADAYVAAHPDSPHGHYYSGLAQIRMKRYDQAVASLDKAKERGADPLLVDLGKGMAGTFGGSWDAAKQALTRIIDADKAFAYAYYYRGLVWNKTGKMDRMVEDLEQFVALAPDAPDAGQARALLSAAGG